MNEIKVTEEEVAQLSRIHASLQNTYLTMGRLREREHSLLAALNNLKETQIQFERGMEEKYHIPGGTNWKVNPTDCTIVLPEPEAEEGEDVGSEELEEETEGS